MILKMKNYNLKYTLFINKKILKNESPYWMRFRLQYIKIDKKHNIMKGMCILYTLY